MSKNQINYLLALATLFVVGFYFNIFYTAAKLERKMPQPVGIQRSPFATRNFPNFASAATTSGPKANAGMPSTMPPLPPEVQKMMQQLQKASPAVPKPEEKK